MARLKEEAEKAKKQLSSAEAVDISIPYLSVREDGQPINLEEHLSRAQFDSMIDHVIEKTVPPMRQAISDAGVELSEIDEIILV